MLTRLAVFSLGLFFANAVLTPEWEAYKDTYGKSYSQQEDIFRRKLWQENMAEISSHNVKFYRGESSYMKGENKFTDMTRKELNEFASLNLHVELEEGADFNTEKYDGLLPAEVDWRKKGYVTEVKDQGACGSCWSFSVTGTIEGQHFNKTGKLVSLSESNLVDCCTEKEGCDGCGGAWPNAAMQYVIGNKGIDTEKSYPYIARQENCKFKASTIGATISKYVNVTKGDEDALQKATAEVGPISVCVDASGFYSYKSGIYDNDQCSRTDLDHAVLVVGYGTEDGKDYWLVKNSWNASWGMKGYIKMSRNKKNQCGIASYAMYPVV